MTNAKSKKSGFTLIELLVVVAIIGLLTSIVSFAVNNSRIKARDAKRISDMKQIKTGLDLYFSHGAGYPDTSVWDAAVGGTLSCGGTNIMQVPRDPITPTYDYTYTVSGNTFAGCGGTVHSAYQVQFYIENQGAFYLMDEDGNLTDSNGNPVGFDQLL